MTSAMLREVIPNEVFIKFSEMTIESNNYPFSNSIQLLFQGESLLRSLCFEYQFSVILKVELIIIEGCPIL